MFEYYAQHLYAQSSILKITKMYRITLGKSTKVADSSSDLVHTEETLPSITASQLEVWKPYILYFIYIIFQVVFLLLCPKLRFRNS